jgi:hypothetical protein
MPAPARADEVSGTRSELLTEREHEVEVALGHGDATLTVRRTVHNGGERHDQAMFWIDVPDGAVANRLRTLGQHRGQPRWFEGDLLEAETAAARYEELTGIGGYTPKDPALLSWRSANMLLLQVFPVAPDTEKTVEYRLVMPMTYTEGRHRLVLSQLGTDTMPATITLVAEDSRDRLFVNDHPVAAGTRVDVSESAELGLARTRAPLVDGGLAVVPIRGGRALVHVDLEAKAQLGTIPRNARIVVAIDTSTSLDATEIAAAITATKAYLSHFVGHDAEVEVIAFDRTVHPRHGRFVPVATALDDLAKLEPVQKNGSHLDSALTHATRLFAGERRDRPRRLLVLTDAKVRESLTEPRLRALASATGAVVHVATVTGNSDTLTRDDHHEWAEVARGTGGLFWDAGVVGEDASDIDVRARFEEWARPVRIDRMNVSAGGLEELMGVQGSLDEGEALHALTVMPRGPRRVVLTGEVWSTPVTKVLVPDRREGDLWAGLAIGTPVRDELGSAEMMKLAKRGRVVSPVTSYLAIEPGVRPSTEGLEPDESGFGVGSGAGGIPRIRVGAHASVRAGRPPDLPGILRGEIRAALDACGGTDRKATVELQTTRFEIVEVDKVVLGGAASPTMSFCLQEATWAIELPGDFTANWQRWTIEV